MMELITTPEELKTSVNQTTEQQEDPAKPIFRRWHQVGFCERNRAMRKHKLSKEGRANPIFNIILDKKSILQVSDSLFLLKFMPNYLSMLIRLSIRYIVLQTGNGFKASLQNTANSDISYELLVSVCIKGIISIEIKDVKEDFKRFKVSL